MNECDNCKSSHFSENLVWITSEEFTPLKGEVVPEWAYKCFDALCHVCYLTLANGWIKQINTLKEQ